MSRQVVRSRGPQELLCSSGVPQGTEQITTQDGQPDSQIRWQCPHCHLTKAPPEGALDQTGHFRAPLLECNGPGGGGVVAMLGGLMGWWVGVTLR